MVFRSVDEVEPVGVLLVAGQHFQGHAGLIGGRADGGRELGAEGVVEGAGDGVRVELQGGGVVLVEVYVDARGFDLQVAGDFLQAGQAADEALELGGLLVELGGIGAVEGVIVSALGHASADADGGGNGERNAQAGDAGKFGTGAIDDLGHGGLALPPREQVDHQPAGSAGGSEVAAAGHGVEGLHIGVLDDDGRDQFLIFHHLIVRGALGGFHGDRVVVVVGVGDEALLHDHVEVSGGPQHRYKQAEHDGAVVQHPVEGDAVSMEGKIENGFHDAVEDAVGGVLAGAQEAAAQHGRQADGDHAGDENGGADGDGELAEEAAQNAGHEEDGDEDGGERKRHGDDGEADLAAAGERGLHGRFAHFDMTDDVLQHDDGVIDHEADREDQRHHGDVVEAEVEQLHHGEGADNGKRQRHGGDHGGREVAQEEENDQHHQDQRGGHGELDVLESLANILGAVAADVEVEGGGDLGDLLILFHPVNDVAHVAQPDVRAVLLGDHHGPVVPGLHQLAIDLDIVGGIGAVERAGGDVDVPIAQRLVDFIEPDLAGSQLVGVHLHAHGVLGGAIDLHLSHAFHHGDALRQHGFGILIEVAR